MKKRIFSIFLLLSVMFYSVLYASSYKMPEEFAKQGISAEEYNKREIDYGKAGDIPKAIENFNQAIALNPKDTVVVVAYNNHGNAYKAAGGIDKANADFAKVKELEAKK